MSLVNRFDIGWALIDIMYTAPFSLPSFVAGIENILSRISRAYQEITGSPLDVSNLDNLRFDTLVKLLLNWRSANNVSPSDVPDWLVSAGASTITTQSLDAYAQQTGAEFRRVIGDPYIPGVSLGRVSFVRLTGSQVSQRNSFDVTITRQDGSTQTLTLPLGAVTTIRFSDILYDVFGLKDSGVQWTGGAMEWLRLPQILPGQSIATIASEVLSGVFAPIHFVVPSQSQSIDIYLEAPTAMQNLRMIIASPSDYTRILYEVPLSLSQPGSYRVTIRGKQSWFFTQPVPAVQISLINITGLLKVTVTVRRRTGWFFW